MPTIYSLENTINSFFESQSAVTREQCDELAISLVGEPVNPAPIQGAFSYTVIAGAKQSKVVQFRTQSSLLDMECLNLTQAIHGQFVPYCTYHGCIGRSSPLPVYVIDKLPGVTYIEASLMNGISVELSSDKRSRQFNTVADLARYSDLYANLGWANSTSRFFAASWEHRQTKSIGIDEAVYHEYQEKLSLLFQALPIRFTESLRQMNIFVDPNTGHITGVIDWADARILPFGISLWGFENLLGYMDSKGWHYYTNHHELRNLFWQTFEEAVKGVSEADRQTILVARMAGFFLRYGFTWEDGVRQVPAKEPDDTLRYLDAFCSINDTIST